jgi:hypothetical protein
VLNHTRRWTVPGSIDRHHQRRSGQRLPQQTRTHHPDLPGPNVAKTLALQIRSYQLLCRTMASCPSMDESEASLRELRSGVSSVQNATRELQDEMTLIAEALDLAHAILSDLVGRLSESDQEDLSADLGRLNDIADTIRLHINHL